MKTDISPSHRSFIQNALFYSFFYNSQRHTDIFDLVSGMQMETIKEEKLEKERRRELKEKKRVKQRQRERERGKEVEREKEKDEEKVLCSRG